MVQSDVDEYVPSILTLSTLGQGCYGKGKLLAYKSMKESPYFRHWSIGIVDGGDRPQTKHTGAHKELKGLETESEERNLQKMSALPPRKLGALVRGSGKVPRGDTVAGEWSSKHTPKAENVKQLNPQQQRKLMMWQGVTKQPLQLLGE